ncbi:hypothetical protein EDB89DRAFT_2072508 [Lactarius sanguifluus]|nr:hypothetical protein EDB89DRAFT_2081387 [Lactarius sanguifluus]KAH9169834.1 hypothetical protein EDB89DRAFT_2072508 [Lactarius sanguifluus]
MFRRSFVPWAGVSPAWSREASSHHHHSAFAEYLVTSADFVVHVLDAWSFEDPSQLGVAPLIALWVLYVLKLPEPLGTSASRLQIPALISGGATSVELYATQFANLSGFYADLSAAKRIREVAPNLEHAVDCMGEYSSTAIITASLSGEGTIAQIILRPIPGVRTLSSIIFDVIGKDCPLPFIASPELTETWRKLVRFLSEIVARANVHPNPALIQPLGLASVADGLRYVSVQRVIYRIVDAPKESK